MASTNPMSILSALGVEDITARRQAVAEDLEKGGVTFGVKSATGKPTGHKVFDIEPIPRIINEHTWTTLATGVEQRARALNSFLEDVYAHDNPEDSAIVRAGKIDAARIRQAPGFTPRGRRLPSGVIRTHVTGTDIVCSTSGDWRVLEDNVRMPSGLTFALAARSVTTAHFPELSSGVERQILPVAGALEMLCTALREAAPEGVDPESAHVIVATEGESDPTWAEQRMIAQAGGFSLCTRDDLVVGPNDRGVTVLWDRRAQCAVDVVYLRVEEHRLPEGIEDALAAGHLTIANALGNGLADDKAIYAYVPEMVRFYLGEEPTVEQVPTWLCADPSQRVEVLDRLAELVVKPVDGYGGIGITIGPECSAAELAVRSAEIHATPERFIAQERVDLCTLPALDGSHRCVDLRMFSLLGNDGATTIPVGLTRVAPAGSMIVNSSRGGGGRDTWIISGSLQA